MNQRVATPTISLLRDPPPPNPAEALCRGPKWSVGNVSWPCFQDKVGGNYFLAGPPPLGAAVWYIWWWRRTLGIVQLLLCSKRFVAPHRPQTRQQPWVWLLFITGECHSENGNGFKKKIRMKCKCCFWFSFEASCSCECKGHHWNLIYSINCCWFFFLMFPNEPKWTKTGRSVLWAWLPNTTAPPFEQLASNKVQCVT